jgi:carbonic anhydrase/acetyltransferase-like protein (isoleucine patch superfamily)
LSPSSIEAQLMAIYRLGDRTPRLASGAWVADSADVIGHVELGEGANVWFGAVLRGDNEPLVVGPRSNIQDASVLHSDPGSPLVIGADVSVGHQVMLHGCSIGDGSLIGIQAVILNGARIGKHCLVGAGSLVTEGKAFEDGWLIMGSPAKAVRPLTPEQIEGLGHIAQHYVENAQRYASTLERVG